ncbi:unnamed protein product [Cochlearia groenlandica]
MDLFRNRRRRKHVILLSILTITSYGFYKAYTSQYISKKTKRLANLIESIVSFFEIVADSSETITTVSRDLNQFLRSDSDDIPNSLKQISKIARSKDFVDSLARVFESVTIGFLHGSKIEEKSNRSFVDKVLFTEEGTGFVSVVVGSFVKSLVLGLKSAKTDIKKRHSFIDLLLDDDDDKCRELLGDCIERLTSSAVSVYIDKTVGVNVYDEIFAGLTNPKHVDKARDVVVSVCNGALETFLRTSREVYVSETDKNKSFTDSGNGWGEVLTTTLAVPSNKKFVFDVTGRVTVVTMRSILEFVVFKTLQSFKKSLDVVHGEVVERGRQVVGYVSAKSSVIITVCLAVYLHVVNRCVRGSSVWLNS